jgi:hypothetical protein
MHADIRRLATNLDIKIHGLQQMFSGDDQQNQLEGVKNLREFVQSAATVLSSTSTVLSENQDQDHEDFNDFRSDFRDWFRTDTNAFTLDWIQSSSGNVALLEASETANIKESSAPRPTPVSGRILDQAATEVDRVKPAPIYEFDWSLPGSREELRSSVMDLAAQGRRGASFSDRAIDLQSPITNSDLSTVRSPVVPRMTYQRSESSEAHLSPVYPSPSKKKRRSLVRLFSRSSSNSKSSQGISKPISKQASVAAEMRRKIVFVGDGASGKTCFLMYVFLQQAILTELTVLSRGSKGTMPEVRESAILVIQFMQNYGNVANLDSRFTSQPCSRITYATLKLTAELLNSPYGIQPVKKTTTGCGRLHIQMPMQSSYASPLTTLQTWITSKKG